MQTILSLYLTFYLGLYNKDLGFDNIFQTS